MLTTASLVTRAPVVDGLRREGVVTPTALDEAAFESFYRRTAAALQRYLRRLVNDSTLADDHLQGAYLQYLRKPPRDHLEKGNATYLYRIATNLARDHWRRGRRETALTETDSVVSVDLDVQHDVRAALTVLSARERGMLWLAHVEERSHREIGAILGVKASSVRVLLFRARRRLARELTRRGFPSEDRT